jgi:hypothetical protein
MNPTGGRPASRAVSVRERRQLTRACGNEFDLLHDRTERRSPEIRRGLDEIRRGRLERAQWPTRSCAHRLDQGRPIPRRRDLGVLPGELGPAWFARPAKGAPSHVRATVPLDFTSGAV